MATHLTRAVSAAQQGDLEKALDALLGAWRALPRPEVADRVVALGEVLGAPVDKKQWEATAKPHRAKDLSTLLASLLDTTSTVARERVESLLEWPEDPRIDRFVAWLFANPPYTSTGARPFWTRLMKLAPRLKDATAWATLEQARAATKLEFVAEYLDRVFRDVERPAPAPLSPADAEALAALDAAFAKKRPAPSSEQKAAKAVLSDVLARPDDDALRRVLADALMEQGDVRGELIALQYAALERPLSAAEKKREKEIVTKHRAHLLGELDEVLKPDVTFSRGFLSRAALKQGNANSLRLAIEKSVGHPLWATVEHLEGSDEAIALHPVMRSLRSLESTSAPLERLAQLPRLEALRGVTIVNDQGRFRQLRDLTASGAFPALRELHVAMRPEVVAPFLAWPRLATLRSVGLAVVLGTQAALTDELLAQATKAAALRVPELVLQVVRYEGKGWGTVCALSRKSDALDVELSVTSPTGNTGWENIVQPDALRLLERLGALKPASLSFKRGRRTDFASLAAAVVQAGGSVD